MKVGRFRGKCDFGDARGSILPPFLEQLPSILEPWAHIWAQWPPLGGTGRGFWAHLRARSDSHRFLVPWGRSQGESPAGAATPLAQWENNTLPANRCSRVGFSTVGVFAAPVAPTKQVTSSLHFVFFSTATEVAGCGTVGVRGNRTVSVQEGGFTQMAPDTPAWLCASAQRGGFTGCRICRRPLQQ